RAARGGCGACSRDARVGPARNRDVSARYHHIAVDRAADCDPAPGGDQAAGDGAGDIYGSGKRVQVVLDRVAGPNTYLRSLADIGSNNAEWRQRRNCDDEGRPQPNHANSAPTPHGMIVRLHWAPSP